MGILDRRQAAPMRGITPGYAEMAPDELMKRAEMGDQNAAAELMKKLEMQKAGPYPDAVRQAAQLPVEDPTGLGGFIGKGQERKNAAGINVTDIVKGFIKEKFPSVGASPHLRPDILKSMLAGPMASASPVADPGGMTGAGDVLGGAPVPGPNPRGVGRAPQIQPVGPLQTPQGQDELDAGLGLPMQAPTGAPPPASEEVPWYAKESTQDLMMNFGLNLLASAEPTPGSAVGPSFGGAIGKAGLATQARSDKQKIRKEAKAAAAATRAFKARENERNRVVKREGNAAKAAQAAAQQRFNQLEYGLQRQEYAAENINRMEIRLQKAVDALNEGLDENPPIASEKAVENYAKRHKIDEDDAREAVENQMREDRINNNEAVKRIRGNIEYWQDKIGGARGTAPAPEPSSMKAAAVGDRALRGIPSGAKKVRRNPDTDEVVYQAADGKWYSPQR